MPPASSTSRQPPAPRQPTRLQPFTRIGAPALLAVALAAGPAHGQIVTSPGPPDGPFRTDLGVVALDDLDGRVVSGDAAGAARVAATILDAAVRAGLAAETCSIRANHVALVWVAVDRTGRTTLRRLHLPQPAARLYSLDLSGVAAGESRAGFYELFLSADPRARLASLYTSSRDTDPLTPQVPAFAEDGLGPFFSLVAGLAGELRAPAGDSRPARERSPGWEEDEREREARDLAERRRQERWERERQELRLHVTAARVTLPYARATVKAASIATVPIAADRFAAGARELAVTLAFRQAAESACAQAYAGRLADAAALVAERPPCTSAPPGLAACLRAFDGAFREAWAVSVLACRPRETQDTAGTARRAPAGPAGAGIPGATGTSAVAPGQATMRGEGEAGGGDEDRAEIASADLQAMRLVDGRFRDLVLATRPERVEAQATFRNRPLVHFGFGAGTGLILAVRSNRTRVRLDRGTFAADPLGRQMTMAFVTWSPRGYDADRFQPSAGERLRPFAGAILTPDFGVGGGISLLVVRGFGVNVGTGLLFTRAAAAGDLLGAPPRDPADPFALGVARVVFLGAGFNFR